MPAKQYFSFMKFAFKLRDLLYPRAKVLAEAGIKEGDTLLDFGCGTGSYEIAASKMAGENGKVYALDKSPEAIETVNGLIKKHALGNTELILSERETGLADESVDVILFYDILHHLKNYREILAEFHRVLKAGGVLSCSDHHMPDLEIIEHLECSGLFVFREKGKKTFTFRKKIQPVRSKDNVSKCAEELN